MLEVHALRKSFGARVAVDGVSFSLRDGEVVGLLGPNGAGKTTTVSMASGLLPPDAGTVRIDGRAIAGDDDPLRRRLGVVPQELALYEELSAAANLAFFGSLYGLSGRELASAVDRNLAFVGLSDRAGDRVTTFSGGMKRRLNIAAGLVHAPSILLFDEPTAGVDPQSRNAIFDNLDRLKAEGKALLYTTHYMEEAERLCDRIVIIDRGRVLADDTLRGLYDRLPAANRLLIEFEAPDTAWLGELQTRVSSASVSGITLAVAVPTLDDTPHVLAWLRDRGVRVTHLVSERASLETVFLELTGRSLRDS